MDDDFEPIESPSLANTNAKKSPRAVSFATGPVGSGEGVLKAVSRLREHIKHHHNSPDTAKRLASILASHGGKIGGAGVLKDILDAFGFEPMSDATCRE